jgi:Tfp pilus assembly protein PilE
MTARGGFTLVELNTAMVAGGILVLAFSSILVLSRNESSSAMQRVQMQQDVMLLDRYIHNQLTSCIGDSSLIYADSTAEQSRTPSGVGTILHTKDTKGNSYRIAASNQNLNWEVNGTIHHPVDARVAGLNFRENTSKYGKEITFGIQLLSQKDTLAYEWVIVFRN